MPLVLAQPPSDTQRPNRGDSSNQPTFSPDNNDAFHVLSHSAVQKQKQLDAPKPRLDIKRRIRGLIGSLPALRAFPNPRSRTKTPQLPESGPPSVSLSLQSTVRVPSLPWPQVTECMTPASVLSLSSMESPVPSSQPLHRTRTRTLSLSKPEWLRRARMDPQDPTPRSRTRSSPQQPSKSSSSQKPKARAGTSTAPKAEKSSVPSPRPPSRTRTRTISLSKPDWLRRDGVSSQDSKPRSSKSASQPRCPESTSSPMLTTPYAVARINSAPQLRCPSPSLTLTTQRGAYLF